MSNQLQLELRFLFPAWVRCLLLPLPAILFWQSADGRRVAIWLFFVGCTSLVAHAFRRDMQSQPTKEPQRTTHLWRTRMSAVGVALLTACVTFSVLCLSLNDSHDLVAVFLAFSLLIPALCVTPFLTLVARKSYAAVVFTLMLVGMMKLLGCVVVVLVYGWQADALGYTTMPWRHPNLLVWLFWLNNGVLALSFYWLGKRTFLRESSTPEQTPPR